MKLSLFVSLGFCELLRWSLRHFFCPAYFIQAYSYFEKSTLFHFCSSFKFDMYRIIKYKLMVSYFKLSKVLCILSSCIIFCCDVIIVKIGCMYMYVLKHAFVLIMIFLPSNSGRSIHSACVWQSKSAHYRPELSGCFFFLFFFFFCSFSVFHPYHSFAGSGHNHECCSQTQSQLEWLMHIWT